MCLPALQRHGLALQLLPTTARRFKARIEQHMKHLPAGALVVVSMMVQNLQR
jgi:cytochrome b